MHMNFEKVAEMRGNDSVSFFLKQVPTDERKSASLAAETQMQKAPASIYSSRQQASLSLLSLFLLSSPTPVSMLALPFIDEYVILPFCCQFISRGVSLQNGMEKCFIVLFPILCIPPAD